MKAFVLVWTTTPWTLPASLAVAVHPDLEYVMVPSAGNVYILAKDLVGQVASVTGLQFGEPVLTLRGKDLEGLRAIHPFYDDREIIFALAEYVGLDQGTGCVHTAPGHGVEDFETGIRYGLDVLNPDDDKGYFLPVLLSWAAFPLKMHRKGSFRSFRKWQASWERENKAFLPSLLAVQKPSFSGRPINGSFQSTPFERRLSNR